MSWKIGWQEGEGKRGHEVVGGEDEVGEAIVDRAEAGAHQVRVRRRWPGQERERGAHRQDTNRPEGAHAMALHRKTTPVRAITAPAARSRVCPHGQRCTRPMAMPTPCRHPVATTKPML